MSVASEYDEGIYDPLYYDCTRKKLTRSDLIYDNDYSRFIALYDDSAEFQINIRRIN